MKGHSFHPLQNADPLRRLFELSRSDFARELVCEYCCADFSVSKTKEDDDDDKNYSVKLVEAEAAYDAHHDAHKGTVPIGYLR